MIIPVSPNWAYNGTSGSVSRVSDDAAVALRSLSEVLSEVNEPQLASSFRRLATKLEAAQTPNDRRSVAGEGLAYFRGMNSLSDLVITNQGKPDVKVNRRVDELRKRAYALLVQQL